MYAIIKSGGKQYRVEKDGFVDVELLDVAHGSEVEFDVLFFFDGSAVKLGEPHLTDFIVRGEIVEEVKGPKIDSVKYIPGNHTKRFGHRQHYSRVKINFIGSRHEKGHKEKGHKHGT